MSSAGHRWYLCLKLCHNVTPLFLNGLRLYQSTVVLVAILPEAQKSFIPAALIYPANTPHN